MDAIQRNGGTAGLVTAALLVLLLILIMSTGLDPQAAADPARALSVIAQKRGLWEFTGIVGALSAAFGIVFTIGLFDRLKGRAPTRASAMLYFVIVGLGGYALSSLMQWVGGIQLADYAAKDQVAASHAWIALRAAIGGFNALGDAFAGASLLIAGWVVITTGGLNPTVGWVGVIAGILSVAGTFAPTSLSLFLGSIVFVIIWLAWAGSELRKPRQT